MSKINPEKLDELRETFHNHLEAINQRINDTMMLLYKLPKIARKFYFELPTWAPKPKVLVSSSKSLHISRMHLLNKNPYQRCEFFKPFE